MDKNEKTGAAVIYLRVSTAEQADSGLGLEAQDARCREYAQTHGLTVAAVYTDAAVSGAAPLDECPALMDALAALDTGAVLLVAKRDRLGRDAFRLAMVEREAQKRRARIVSAAGEGTETDDPADVLMRRIVDAFAEYERLIIKARTRAALNAKRTRRERLGTTPLGYVTRADGAVHPNPAELVTVERARDLRAEGHTLRAIARMLTVEGHRTKRGGAWAPATVAGLLKPRYLETCSL